MIKNITIGQYFPGTSAIHRLDPRIKLVLTVAYVVMLFISKNLYSLGLALVLVVLVYGISRVPISVAIKSIKGILPIIMFTAILNMFFVDGKVVWQWWVFKITVEGLLTGALMTTRIILLILGTSILTYTTSPIALTDGIERLFSPLKKFHLPVHEVAMMMTIALRFIPTLIEETDKIMSAQKARGADMESGNLLQRIKALLPILIPLFVSAFRRADELALAMESRCYHGGEGRTRMRQMHLEAIDFIACLVMLFGLAGTVFLGTLPSLI